MAKKRRVAVAINLGYPFTHHFDVFAGIERYSQEHGTWECVVDPFVQLVRQNSGGTNFDGVVARASGELARQAARVGVPVVNVWSGSPAKTLPTVLADYGANAEMAAAHLLLRGYRRFAFQGFVRHGGTREALAGYKAALRTAKCPWTTLLVSPKHDEGARGWHKYMGQLQQWIATWKPPLGVLSVQDHLSRYLASVCLRVGLRIPEDVALIGLGNEHLVCTHPEPSLSSIDMALDRVGYEAAALLDRLMEGEPSPESFIRIPAKELVIRRSTNTYLVENPLVRQALTFIAEHSHEGIRVDDVAKHVCAAVRSLERHFSASLGRTMTEEIARLRLERATRLLVESDESIKLVARACGYSDANYFHQVFFKVHGVPPREYRRNHRSGSRSMK